MLILLKITDLAQFQAGFLNLVYLKSIKKVQNVNISKHLKLNKSSNVKKVQHSKKAFKNLKITLTKTF